MSDDVLRALAEKADGPRWQECRIHYALRYLPVKSSGLLAAALANPHATHAEIAAVVNSRLPEEWMTDQATVGRHRGGRCRCAKCSCEMCTRGAA